MVERIMLLEEAYGMAMNVAQQTTGFTPPDATTNAYTVYQSYCQSSIASGSSSPSSINFKLDANSSLSSSSPPSLAAEMEGSISPPVSQAVKLVPEGARVKPLGVFQPRDGYPPGTTEKDIANWNRGSDQIYLHFSRNECDQATNTWQTVYGYVPIDV